jgi:hypothetical protein
MGGRGAAGGVSAQGYKYGTEFKTLMSVDNIKFVQYQNSTAATIPQETMSFGRNRVYVLVKDDKLKSITLYNSKGIVRRQIDLDHAHKGLAPHVHTVNVKTWSRKIVPATKSDIAYIEKVRTIWNNR